MENKEKKNKGGRKPTPYPEGWEHVYNEWQSGEFSSVEACQILKLPKGTFYNMAKRYERQNNLVGVRYPTTRKVSYKGQERVASLTGRYADLARKYSDYIERNILPCIDYRKLQASYHSVDMEYAKGILNLLYQAMLKIYGGNFIFINENKADYSVDASLIPGVIEEKDEIRLALLLMDSNGELIRFEVLSVEGDPMLKTLCISGYGAKIPNKHIYINKLSCRTKKILDSFENFKVRLLCNNSNRVY